MKKIMIARVAGSLALAACAVVGGAAITGSAGASDTSPSTEGVSVVAPSPSGDGVIVCSFSVATPSSGTSSLVPVAVNSSGTVTVVSGTLPTLDPSVSGSSDGSTVAPVTSGNVSVSSGDTTTDGSTAPTPSSDSTPSDSGTAVNPLAGTSVTGSGGTTIQVAPGDNVSTQLQNPSAVADGSSDACKDVVSGTSSSSSNAN